MLKTNHRLDSAEWENKKARESGIFTEIKKPPKNGGFKGEK